MGRQGGTQVVNLGEEGCFTSKTVNFLGISYLIYFR